MRTLALTHNGDWRYTNLSAPDNERSVDRPKAKNVMTAGYGGTVHRDAGSTPGQAQEDGFWSITVIRKRR